MNARGLNEYMNQFDDCGGPAGAREPFQDLAALYLDTLAERDAALALLAEARVYACYGVFTTPHHPKASPRSDLLARIDAALADANTASTATTTQAKKE